MNCRVITRFKILAGFILLEILMLVLIAGCLHIPAGVETDSHLQNTSSSDSVVITDALNNKIILNHPPQRIISQNGNILPLIIALGAGDRVVGVPENSIGDTEIMAALPNAHSVGDWQTLSSETILSLNPDILIAYTNFKPKNIDQIVAQNLTIIYLDCYHVARLPNESRTLGKILGKEAEAEAYAQKIEQYLSLIRNRVSQVPDKLKPVRAYPELYGDYHVMGNGSMGEEILTMLKVNNIASTVHLNPTINREWVIEQNPDIIIKIASDSDPDFPDLHRIHERITTREGFSHISAVKNNRIYVIRSDAFSGARSIAGTLYLAKAFYPEYFQDIDPAGIFKSYNQTFIPVINGTDLFYPDLAETFSEVVE